MDLEHTGVAVGTVFSSYGLVTAQRILERYQIHVPAEHLVTAVQNPTSFYHQLLRIPLKNVMNGIVLQQANDYYVYLQKLFIDYLLSPEAAKDSESQGAMTREEIEEERKKLETMNEAFQRLQMNHDNFISMTQNILLAVTEEWKEIHKQLLQELKTNAAKLSIKAKVEVLELAITKVCCVSNIKEARNGNTTSIAETIKSVLSDDKAAELVESFNVMLDFTVNLDEALEAFQIQANEINRLACSHRTEFYDMILRVLDLLHLLSEYKIDPEKDEINKETLDFDNTIGES